MLRAVAGQAADSTATPTWPPAELTTALASAFDIPTDHIAVGAGPVGVLGQILAAVATLGSEVVHA